MTIIPFTKEELIRKLGLEGFAPALQEEFLSDSLVLIQQRLTLRMMERLGSETNDDDSSVLLNEFRTVVEGGTDKVVAEWIQENVPEVRAWADEEIKLVRASILRIS